MLQFFKDGTKEKHIIPKGHLFIFACDLVHGGMELPDNQWHIRIHGLLKSPEYRNGGKTQGWLQIYNGEFEYLPNCGAVQEDVNSLD